jgi:hypothetical protein
VLDKYGDVQVFDSSGKLTGAVPTKATP